MGVYIEKETEEELGFDYGQTAQDVVAAVLSHYQCPYEASVNLFLKGADEIRSINAQFRGVDKVTDVLSFPNVPFEAEADFSVLEDAGMRVLCFDPESGGLLLGDILICQERMRQQAEEYGHSERREFAFLLTHSMMHLLGFDHMEEEDRRRMEEAQDEILDALRIYRE